MTQDKFKDLQGRLEKMAEELHLLEKWEWEQYNVKKKDIEWSVVFLETKLYEHIEFLVDLRKLEDNL